MIRIIGLTRKEKADATLTLSFEQRRKSRLRTALDSGEEAVLMLPRGLVLRHGDRVCTEEGRVIAVQAADEEVSEASADEPRLLARACYHLGNRHVALQIGADWLRYPSDHVLDEMLRGLGLTVSVRMLPFEPEAGAYHGDHGHEH